MNIPNGITSIERSTFDSCLNLVSITIPNSVNIIKDSAFRNSGLTSVTIPASVYEIGDYAFYHLGFLSKLTSVTFQGIITSGRFGGNAFLGDLRNKFYATDAANGTPGTYIRTGGNGTTVPYTWTKQ